MDTRTRHALKNDKFAQATASSVSWVSGHRSSVVRWAAGAAVAFILCVAALVFWDVRSTAADTALGAALDVYNSPLAAPGAPASPGTYATAADRAKEANRQFVAVAHDFSWISQGARAHYFAGITFEELGQNDQAEKELKAAAGAWSGGDQNLANLAKLALAGLYRQTNRESLAIDMYNELAAKPSETVSKAAAQLGLADLYAADGKQDQAKALWAKVKDADKDGAAGSIAAQKLSGK